MAKQSGGLSARITGVPDLNRSLGGRVYVENAAILEDLIASSPPHSSQFQRTKGSRGKEPPSPSDQTNIKLHRRVEVDNSHLLVLEARKAKREQKFPNLLAKVDKATEFLDTVEKEMQLEEEAKRNKTRRQFEEWNNSVHGVIQQKIAQSIEAMDKGELNRRKNRDYGKFLDVTNRKPAIFRDIIIESEYDPLEPNRRCIKARTGKLHDPPKLGIQKAEREASMLGSAGAKRGKEPLGKNTLGVELWASGKIEATPYGIFSKMMTKERSSAGGDQDSPAATKSATLKSHIHFDHYNYPVGNAAVDAEMPKGKRIYPSIVYSDPGRVFGNLPPEVEREIAAIHPPRIGGRFRESRGEEGGERERER